MVNKQDIVSLLSERAFISKDEANNLVDKLFGIRVPKGWTVVQVITFVDASTFDVYVANMKAMMMEQLSTADMIVFNRCDENTRRAEYRRSIKAVNRRAQVIFENKDGIYEIINSIVKNNLVYPIYYTSDNGSMKVEVLFTYDLDSPDNNAKEKYNSYSIQYTV